MVPKYVLLLFGVLVIGKEVAKLFATTTPTIATIATIANPMPKADAAGSPEEEFVHHLQALISAYTEFFSVSGSTLDNGTKIFQEVIWDVSLYADKNKEVKEKIIELSGFVKELKHFGCQKEKYLKNLTAELEKYISTLDELNDPGYIIQYSILKDLFSKHGLEAMKHESAQKFEAVLWDFERILKILGKPLLGKEQAGKFERAVQLHEKAFPGREQDKENLRSWLVEMNKLAKSMKLYVQFFRNGKSIS